MSEYEWDNQIEYLTQTRGLYYNDDYLEFLIQKVWKIHEPVKMVDYGCGYGYLGLKLLPMLPKGSSYTGVDKGEALIEKARQILAKLPYPTEFIREDVEELDLAEAYDVAICHAFLLHMKNPETTLKKMIRSVVHHGKVICFEPHWSANMANYRFEGLEQSSVIPLGILQKLYEKDCEQHGKDGNIGIRVPALLSQLGLKNIECRVSDKVNFLDPTADQAINEELFNALRAEGIGHPPGDREKTLDQLMQRGLTADEAKRQYEAELLLSNEFSISSWLTYAPNMKISFGTVVK
ncbi:class I SAM-dependent methyltransferase [Cohnella sp. GCM10012308]|uniref:class I SAM-dependent methyltransferase n=1 Tax=Cohnella sp. GCM10012308 TaxID=3317329 RepID=UPI00360F1C46